MIKRVKYFIPFFGFLFFFNIASAGFGVSPGAIKEDKLVPGSSLENIIYLVQGNPDVDVNIKASVESNDIKDWFTFENGDEFVIPAGIQQYPLKIKVKVPDNAELGEYKAFVRVNTIPKEGNVDGQVAISLGGRIDYNLIVGNNVIKEYSVIGIDILDIKQNKNPRASFKIKNTGNVAAAPVAASFELFNKFGTVRLGFVEVDKFKKVPSFSEGTQEVEFPIDIKFAPGEYWGDIKVYDDSGKIIGNMRTVFNVTEVTLLEKIMDAAWKIGGAVLGLIVLFLISKFLKRRKAKKEILS